ncbi:hypothetical protein ACIQ6K_26365 [Streptomyces sp. NPDC096354]|uniref:hypothetical protein n=1 Tax=Streptomyces sp. NPDC096354 TaxID=3366088 RepID=UPI003807E962
MEDPPALPTRTALMVINASMTRVEARCHTTAGTSSTGPVGALTAWTKIAARPVRV